MLGNIVAKTLSKITGYNFIGYKKVVQKHKLADHGVIFLAIKGKNVDGRSFAQEAIDMGAAVICDQLNLDDLTLPDSDRLILVDDMNEFMKACIASICESFKESGAKIIAITGSSGKTSTKLWMIHALKNKFPSMHSVPEEQLNYNSDFTGPFLFLCGIQDDTPAIVLEVGIGGPGQMELVAPLLRPDLSIVTNVGIAHLKAFKNREELIKEKLSICNYSKECIIPDEFAQYREAFYFKKPIKIESSNQLEGIIELDQKLFNRIAPSKAARERELEIEGVLSSLDTKKSPSQEVKIILKKILQPHALENIAAIITALAVLFPEIDFSNEIKNIEALKGRGRIFEIELKGKRFKIFDSSYNANASKNGSMYRELQTLERLAYSGSSIGAILGEMLEIGETSAELHSEILNYAVSLTRKLCLVGNWPIEGVLGWRSIVHQAEFLNRENVEEFIDRAFDSFSSGDIILIKGSNGTGLYNTLIPKLLEYEVKNCSSLQS